MTFSGWIAHFSDLKCRFTRAHSTGVSTLAASAARRLGLGAELERTLARAGLLAASDAFEREFVKKQRGITKRMLLRGKHGGYADLVFFESKEDADRVASPHRAFRASSLIPGYRPETRVPHEPFG